MLHSTDAAHFKAFVDEAKSTLAAKQVVKESSEVTVRPEFAEASSTESVSAVSALSI